MGPAAMKTVQLNAGDIAAFASLVGVAGAVMIAALVTVFRSLGGSPARGVRAGLFEGIVIAFALILAAITAAAGIFYLHSGIPADQHAAGKLLQHSSVPLLLAVLLLAALSVGSRLPDSISLPAARTVTVMAIFSVVGEVVGVGLLAFVSLPLSWILVIVAGLLAIARAAAFGIDRLLKRLTEPPSKPLHGWLARQLFGSPPSRRHRSQTFHDEGPLDGEHAAVEVYTEEELDEPAGRYNRDWCARGAGSLTWTRSRALSCAIALVVDRFENSWPAWLRLLASDVENAEQLPEASRLTRLLTRLRRPP